MVMYKATLKSLKAKKPKKIKILSILGKYCSFGMASLGYVTHRVSSHITKNRCIPI
jgi:hypothetical protein